MSACTYTWAVCLHPSTYEHMCMCVCVWVNYLQCYVELEHVTLLQSEAVIIIDTQSTKAIIIHHSETVLPANRDFLSSGSYNWKLYRRNNTYIHTVSYVGTSIYIFNKYRYVYFILNIRNRREELSKAYTCVELKNTKIPNTPRNK